MRKFYGHVPQSAKTDHANFLAFGDAPVMHRGIRRDPGAEQRRSSGEVKVGWDAQNETVIDNDAIGVAAVGHASEVFVRRVEGENHVLAEFLKASLAVWAGAVRIDHAADRGEVARLVLGNCRTDLGHTADDLVAGYDRIVSGHELAPFVADRMEIGVANATEQNFDLHIVLSWIATRNFGGRQRRCRTGSGVSFRVVRSWMHILNLFFSIKHRAEL